jgi:type II secretory pathway predicted ATPase ExeA
VSLPSHDEALARLMDSIETSQRWVNFTAAEGLGKTTVLRRALAGTRSAGRRTCLVSCPPDGTLLLTRLAERLGARVRRDVDRLAAWLDLERALKVRVLEGFHLVLALDDCAAMASESALRDLDSLSRVGLAGSTGLTIIQVARTSLGRQGTVPDSWSLSVGLVPLTVSQVTQYLPAKLAAAGNHERIFTPRSITRIQCLSSGVPRGIERLASLCMMAGAVRGLEAIPPELVDDVAEEFCRAAQAG